MMIVIRDVMRRGDVDMALRLDVPAAMRANLTKWLPLVWLALVLAGFHFQLQGEPFGWLFVLVIGASVTHLWVARYLAWLKATGRMLYDRHALALLPPLLPERHADRELQRALCTYNRCLKVLRLDFQALRRDVPPAWLAWTPRRMKAGVDAVIASQEFRTMSEVAGDLMREHDELVQRLHEAENAG